MIILLTIFQYLIQACVDLMDKFLITARKIEPVSYTFYTVVTGLILLVVWPWTFSHIETKFVILNLLSGAVFSLAMFVFFKVLSEGEASRVIPYVFGIVPVFDLLIGYLTGRNLLEPHEFAAMFLLVPGALLVSYQKNRTWAGHLGMKTVSAFLFSSYYALWQFSSQQGLVLNSLMWNRIGAAAVLLLPLVIPVFRKKVFAHQQIEHKRSTSAIFVFKQALGGINFVFLSFLFSLGTISVINALQGFRYIFILVISTFLSKKRKHMIEEDVAGGAIRQKVFGTILIFCGVILLFL